MRLKPLRSASAYRGNGLVHTEFHVEHKPTANGNGGGLHHHEDGEFTRF